MNVSDDSNIVDDQRDDNITCELISTTSKIGHILFFGNEYNKLMLGHVGGMYAQ